MIQLDLELVEVSFSCGYKCKSCLKIFQTNKEMSKHSTRHVKHRRKSKTINYSLEQFGFITTKFTEISKVQHLSLLRWVY